MPARKGTRPPAAGKGRPKGALNKKTVKKRLIQGNILERVEEINIGLDAEGKGLMDCARQDPKWFHQNFTAKTIPRNMETSGPGGGTIPKRIEVALVGSTSPKNQG